MTKATSPDGFTVYFEYDGKNRVTKAYDEEGNTVKRTLDLVGRLRTLTDPNGNTTKYTYYGPDNNGRLKTVEDAEKRKTTFEYNAAGQVTRVVDNANRETLSEYDALGRAVRVVSPVYEDAVLGAVRPVTTYTYNTLGHQSAVYAGYTTHVTGVGGNDQLKVQATYNYDDYGRVLKSCDALNQCSTQTYDKHSNVLTSTTPIGQVTTYDYGVGGLLINQHTAGVNGQADETISYQYNALGQPLEVISNNVTYTYTYDRAHRVKTVKDSRGNKSVSYDYSAGGLLNQIQDSDGNSTRYLYDPTGRLTGIRTADQGLVSYIYDAGGLLQQKVFPNDLTTAYTYFKDNKIKSIETRKGDERLFRYSYDYNKAGETSDLIHYRLDGVEPTHTKYDYDGLGRLIEANDFIQVYEQLCETCPISLQGKRTPFDTISYDPYGNRRERTVNGETHVYSHNDLHQITGIKDKGTNASIASFAYDTNGNMVSKTFEGKTATLGYDALDRLNVVSISGQAEKAETYAYDHGIRRIKKTVGSDVQQFHYSGSDIIAEYGSNWDRANAVYSHGAAVDDPLLRLAANDPRYYHGDGLDSITAVSNGKGEIVASNEYDHWGNITASTGTTPQFGYTGREPDATGLVYYRNRYYDPQIGRFTQLDPKGFIDGVNRYAYVMNSPVNYVDPWGLSASNPIFNFDSGGIGSGQNNTIDPYSIGQTNYLETFFPSIHQPIQAQPWSAAEADAYYNSPEFQNQGALSGTFVDDLTPAYTIKLASKAWSIVKKVVDIEKKAPDVKWGAQEKHFPGHNSYTPGRSTMTSDPLELAKKAGQGQQVGKIPVGQPGSKERINFGENIGTYIDKTGSSSPTTNGIIHYSKDGIHIVPARP
ncbi:RHS repeat-associated core domain-containing protein [Candidatus Sororendozoicomonas aggregata]|uniref:RHS repeat-associated core domain-containing protein n=1 Tax=Candidatus Sororendozoicomonas aggregata TaxID=3073239 RepID=UPI003B75BC17